MSADLDPDRLLALSYVPARRRAAVGALWRLDASLGKALAAGGEPVIARIKLAWWREAVEPVLEQLAAHVVPALSGEALALMEGGWAVLADSETLGAGALEGYAGARGGLLFRFTARLLGGEEAGLDSAGRAWALVDLARHCATTKDSDVALAAARAHLRPGRWPSRLRPLGMLAVLAARDAEPGRPPWETRGSPGRMIRMLRHRITGY